MTQYLLLSLILASYFSFVEVFLMTSTNRVKRLTVTISTILQIVIAFCAGAKHNYDDNWMHIIPGKCTILNTGPLIHVEHHTVTYVGDLLTITPVMPMWYLTNVFWGWIDLFENMQPVIPFFYFTGILCGCPKIHYYRKPLIHPWITFSTLLPLPVYFMGSYLVSTLCM